MAGEPAAGRTAAHAGPRRGRLAISPKVITAAVIVIAAVWFIIVNRARISIFLWVPKVTAPLWLVLVIFFAGGLITGLLLQRSKNNKQQR